MDKKLIDTITYVDSGELLDINESNYLEDGDDPNEEKYALVKEQEVTQSQIYRMRLSYDDIEAVSTGDFRLQVFEKMENGEPKFINYGGANTYEVASIYGDKNPYETVGPDKIVLVKETGELLLGENVYKDLMKKNDDPTTTENESEIRLKYKKKNWEGNDLRPEHYFACSTEVDNKTIHYNSDYLQGISDEEKQTIEYDVGLNQTIRVNTTADEVFTHNISRDVEDMVKAMEDTVAMQKQVEKFKKMLEENTIPENKPVLENQLAAMEKAFTFLNEKTQKMFENGITKMQKHLDAVNFAVTENGTRGQKLELISNRLMSQKTNFETLKSENEDISFEPFSFKVKNATGFYDLFKAQIQKIASSKFFFYSK